MRTCLIFLYCLTAAILFSQEPPETAATTGKISFSEHEEKEFRFYPGGKMQIRSGVPGYLRIVGWKKGAVRVEAEKTVRDLSPERAESIIKECPLRVRWNQTSARIQVEGVPPEGTEMEYNLTVYVPGDKTDIKATMRWGDISVEAVNGWVEVTTGRGDLNASSMSGYFSGSTDKGNILVAMSGKRWRGLEFGAVTQTGSIDLRLPQDYSAALQLETLDGKVFVDYPPRILDGEPVPLQVGIRKKARALEAAVGAGGAPVKLISHAGDIRLSLKK